MASVQHDPAVSKSTVVRRALDAQVPQETEPESGLLIGPRLADSEPAKRPERVVLEGRYTRLEPLNGAQHGNDLYTASTPPDAALRFRYLGDPLFRSRKAFDA